MRPTALGRPRLQRFNTSADERLSDAPPQRVRSSRREQARAGDMGDGGFRLGADSSVTSPSVLIGAGWVTRRDYTAVCFTHQYGLAQWGKATLRGDIRLIRLADVVSGSHPVNCRDGHALTM